MDALFDIFESFIWTVENITIAHIVPVIVLAI